MTSTNLQARQDRGLRGRISSWLGSSASQSESRLERSSDMKALMELGPDAVLVEVHATAYRREMHRRHQKLILLNHKLKQGACTLPEIWQAGYDIISLFLPCPELNANDPASLEAGFYRSATRTIESVETKIAAVQVAQRMTSSLSQAAAAIGCQVKDLGQAANLPSRRWNEPSASAETVLQFCNELGAIVEDLLSKHYKPIHQVERENCGEGWNQPIPATVSSMTERAEQSLDGWCSRQKADMLVRAILAEKPQTVVELGIYGGRSIVPIAAALKHLGSGCVYGIETWSGSVAVEYRTGAVNDAWWQLVNIGEIKRRYLEFVCAQQLTDWIKLIEVPTSKAFMLFDSIDFLHIDGGHSRFGAAEDVVLYVKKVRSGGIIVFDDVNWSTTSTAVEVLRSVCDVIDVLREPSAPHEVACAAFRKR